MLVSNGESVTTFAHQSPEQGIVAPTGQAHVGHIATIIYDDDGLFPGAVYDLELLLLYQSANWNPGPMLPRHTSKPPPASTTRS